MARKSSVQRLDVRLRSAVDELLRDGRHTLDDILAHLATINGGAAPVSRSALGRYAQRAEEQMRRYREAQEVARKAAERHLQQAEKFKSEDKMPFS